METHVNYFTFVTIQGGPEKILLETIDAFVVNSNFCEPPRRSYFLIGCDYLSNHKLPNVLFWRIECSDTKLWDKLL